MSGTTTSSVAQVSGAPARAIRPAAAIPGADELFRSLYTGFDLSKGASLAICSAISGEGKTTISLGLAVAMAHDLPDRRILVIETDLWRPVLASDFALEPEPGLVDCLLGRESLAAALRPTALRNLFLLVAGKAGPNAQQLLRSARMPELLAELKKDFDLLIVDTPAALAHSEVALVARMVDEAVFVVRTGVTPSGQLQTALDRLQSAKVRGVVLNDARSSVPELIRRVVGR